MLVHRCFVVAGVGVLLLSGCSNPKDANKANFKTALQQWFDANPVCTPLTPDQNLPIQRATNDRANKPALDAAVAAGLLSAQPAGPAGGLVYRPTDAAQSAIRQHDAFLGGVDICFAHRKVDTIDSFTEPADMMGVKASRVTFTYSLEDVAPWATQPAIAAAVPAIGQALARPSQTDTAGLVLTNEGWKDEHALR